MPILLVRHPRADIPPGLCYGRLDVPALPAALAPLRDRLRATGITRIHTSPARRCRCLAEALTPTPIVDPRLQELDFGAWEGQPWDQIPRPALDAWAADPAAFAPPGGETGASLLARIAAFARDLGPNPGQPGAIVITHGGPLRLLPALLRGEPPDLLAPPPPQGAILELHPAANAVSASASATHAHPPSTSPV